MAQSIEALTDFLDADDLLDLDDDTDSDSDSSTTFTPAVYSRRVLLRNNQQVSEERIVAFNKTLEVEREFLEQAQAEILKDFFESKDKRSESDRRMTSSTQEATQDQSFENEHLILLSGIQQDVQQKVDRVAQGAGFTTHKATSSTIDRIPKFADTLLADVFDVCKFPNEAEMMMLTVACGLPGVLAAGQWCKSGDVTAMGNLANRLTINASEWDGGTAWTGAVMDSMAADCNVPFSAKWAILAKACSVLRGSRGKDEAPLDFFLGLVVPLMGIVAPEHYQAMMGWQVTAPSDSDQDKTPRVVRLFTPDFSTFDNRYISTTLSVDDLVQYCMSSGYLNDTNARASVGNAHGALTMAVHPTVTAVTAATAAPLHTHPANLNITAANNATIADPLSPDSLSLATQLGMAINSTLPPAPAAPPALTTAATAATNALNYSYGTFFDPTSKFDYTFNPTEETAGLGDDGFYPAFDPTASMSVDDALNLDWSQFVNDDGSA
ncbi:hypothetical protein B0A55_10878 [Friedmanniomyces simplex]|uniref:Mating-type protein MAT-1 n=1 Tax=Friedmanniomyces simplex TaxID=329884 RepID=A0A4U0WTB6_9PEZI|nr:hypothetical protein B0A55_10878 [Friedmanniomyces simplex]